MQEHSSVQACDVVFAKTRQLSAFKFAPPELCTLEDRLMKMADIVFVGGATLFEAKKHRHHHIHLFPSSIDKKHFSSARRGLPAAEDQASIPQPRLGYYGVLDERLDIPLIREVAKQRSNWQFVFIGPVVKIDPDTLPEGSNIHYLGSKDYAALPAYLSGWDIAILPFERNESTKFISPTKTPEYLAGGKPVISTSIADVVDPYFKNGLVELADTPEEFIQAAEYLLHAGRRDSWLRRTDSFLKNVSWDVTFSQMSGLMAKALAGKEHMKEEVVYITGSVASH